MYLIQQRTQFPAKNSLCNKWLAAEFSYSRTNVEVSYLLYFPKFAFSFNEREVLFVSKKLKVYNYLANSFSTKIDFSLRFTPNSQIRRICSAVLSFISILILEWDNITKLFPHGWNRLHWCVEQEMYWRVISLKSVKNFKNRRPIF